MIELPEAYWRYLETDGVDAALVDGEPGYFQLWHPDDVEKTNQDLSVSTHAPGFLGFGSNGGGEMLAFDSTGAVFKIPFVGMAASEAIRIASSWTEVAARIEK